MERWAKGVILTGALTAMLISNRFIDLGEVQRVLDLAELAFLIFAVLRLSGYTREELGLGGEFSVVRHVLFPFAFFVLPLFVVFFVPHRAVSPGLFALYVLNFILVAGLSEELLFRGLLFASLEEHFGWVGALVGVTLLHWVAHVFIGLNVSQLLASFVLTSYRLTSRRVEPLIIVHALWDATFIALRRKSVGFSALLLIFPVPVGTLLSLIVFFTEKGQKEAVS